MKTTAEQVIKGMIDYADSEVIGSLPTTGKWLMGTGIGIATAKLSDVIEALKENSIVQMMGIVDEDGMFDVDLIIDNMKKSANRYGKMSIQVPLVGKLTFSESDIDSLRNYIERS